MCISMQPDSRMELLRPTARRALAPVPSPPMTDDLVQLVTVILFTIFAFAMLWILV